MTPFESLLWNVWLPKVRSTINNEWSPEDPQPAVKLYEAWSTYLPPFIRDNMLDQLILPKVHKTVTDWNSKRSTTSLRSIVFPWLPFVGLRLEDLIGDARRKIKSVLRSWVIGEDIPQDLAAWRDVSHLEILYSAPPPLLLTDFAPRFTTRANGIPLHSNISSQNSDPPFAPTSASIPEIKICLR